MKTLLINRVWTGLGRFFSRTSILWPLLAYLIIGICAAVLYIVGIAFWINIMHHPFTDMHILYQSLVFALVIGFMAYFVFIISHENVMDKRNAPKTKREGIIKVVTFIRLIVFVAFIILFSLGVSALPFFGLEFGLTPPFYYLIAVYFLFYLLAIVFFSHHMEHWLKRVFRVPE